jgi:chromate transporter
MIGLWFDLLITFAKIGLFGFGGGYAMVPMLEREIAVHGWLSTTEFLDIVAISQMTPGAIAVNAATYIGFRTAGVVGALTATFGLVLPSLILVMLAARFFLKFQEKQGVQAVLGGIRPVTIGLIGSAVLFFMENSIFTGALNLEWLGQRILGCADAYPGFPGVSIGGILIFCLAFVSARYLKVNPILVVGLSIVAGIFVM